MAETKVDDAIRSTLAHELGHRRAPVVDDPHGAVWRRVVRRRRHRVALASVAGLLIVGVVVPAVAVVVDGADDAHIQTPPASQGSVDLRVDAPDGIETLPPPPLDVRGEAAMTYTGRELFVWGGDLEAGNLGAPHLGPSRSYDDGAVYSPASRSWTMLAPAPLPRSDVMPFAASTSAGVVVVRSLATALWIPDTGEWRRLDDAPAGVLDLTSIGNGAVSVSANARLDSTTGAWQTLPAQPLTLRDTVSVWTGDELVVIGRPPSSSTAAAMAYAPATQTWRAMAQTPADLHSQALAAGWDGERVVVVNYDMGAAAYDPRSDAWQELAPVPARFWEWYPKLASAGGTSAAFMGSTVAVLDRDLEWVPVPYGAIPHTYPAVTSATSADDPDTGIVFVMGLDRERGENVVTALDLRKIATQRRAIQVGVFAVSLDDVATFTTQFRPTNSPMTEGVFMELRNHDGSSCTVAAGQSVAVTGPIETMLDNDRRPTTWWHDESGQRWQSRDRYGNDTIDISCENANAARRLAEQTSFVQPM